MKALAKGLATIVLVAAAAACDGSPTAGSALVSADDGISAAQQPGSTLTFTSTQSYETQSPQTATGGVGGIDFTGSLTTGTPCYTVTGTHSHRRSDVTVTITATGTGGFCAQVITHNNYTGRVSGLAAGTYNFTVVHRIGSTSETAFSGSVTVQ